MDLVALAIPDVKLVRSVRFPDSRGIFCELYNRQAFSLGGISVDFLQDNYSLSHQAGTIRGLHFQAPPMGQAKLVTVLRGRVRDVSVDCRNGSATFGRHVEVDL